jgi:hypothetical protein
MGAGQVSRSALTLQMRGERPAVPTGHHLISRMMGDVTYISRSEYADREAMFATHVTRIAGGLSSSEARVSGAL